MSENAPTRLPSQNLPMRAQDKRASSSKLSDGPPSKKQRDEDLEHDDCFNEVTKAIARGENMRKTVRDVQQRQRALKEQNESLVKDADVVAIQHADEKSRMEVQLNALMKEIEEDKQRLGESQKQCEIDRLALQKQERAAEALKDECSRLSKSYDGFVETHANMVETMRQEHANNLDDMQSNHNEKMEKQQSVQAASQSNLEEHCKAMDSAANHNTRILKIHVAVLQQALAESEARRLSSVIALERSKQERKDAMAVLGAQLSKEKDDYLSKQKATIASFQEEINALVANNAQLLEETCKALECNKFK